MKDEKVLVERLPGLLLEEVVPWLYNRVNQILVDQTCVTQNLDTFIEQAFDNGQK